MEANPYAPPKAEILNAPSDAERIRQEHIKTESTIRSAGFLYYLAGFFMTLGGLSGLISISRLEDIIFAGILLPLGLLFLAMGRGLRKLRRWVRVPTIIFSCIGLLGFPMGTLINGVILANIASKKATTILTLEYQEIIAVTPHVKQKSSKVALVLLILLLGLLTYVIYLGFATAN